MNLRSNTGAALPIVLVFSVFALIVASLYITAQFTIGKPSLTGPSSLQALFNARSGIWKGMELMSRPSTDTLARINTLDSMFNKKLFGKPLAVTADSQDAGIVPGDSATEVTLFASDSFGTCSLLLTYAAGLKVIASTGVFRNISKTVRASLGGILYASPDTVCRLLTGDKPTGGMIVGQVKVPGPELLPVLQAPATRTTKTPAPKKPVQKDSSEIRQGELARVVAYYRALLREQTDTIIPNVSLTVQNENDLKNIPDIVKGPLFLNSSFSTLVWKEKRRVLVLGDIQITGKTVIEDVELVSTGEVKCFDQCRLHNVSVVCLKRLLVGDMAIFSGSALSLSAVLVYKNGRIEDKSIIVSYGENKAIAADTSQKGKPQLPFSVFLSQNARVDGVVIAYGNLGGIKTDKNVVVRGILWSAGTVVHQGSLYGVLRAHDCTDLATVMTQMKLQQTNTTAVTSIKNVIPGSIQRLQSLSGYFCPFFMGRTTIAKWEEG